MEKEFYEKPIAQLIKMETKDIVTTSTSIELPDDDFE